MIEINIDPTIVRFGAFALTWHGLFTAVGLLVGIMVGVRLGTRVGFSEDDLVSVALWGTLGGILGARIVHIIDQWPYYAADPVRILTFYEGGMAIFGTIVGGPLAGAIYAWRRGLPIGKLADVAAPALILGMGIGRIGDIINGEHHGVPYDGPLAVVYTHPETLGQIGVPVHLAVGYELVWDLIVFAICLALFQRLPRSGMVFWLMVGLYSVGRFVISFFRIDTVALFGLSQAQIIAVLSAIVSVWALTFLSVRASREARARATTPSAGAPGGS